MSDSVLELPPKSEPLRVRARRWLARTKNRFILAGAAIGLVLLIVLSVWLLAPTPEGALTPKTLHELPARPEDIEKHGQAARTTLAPEDARDRNEKVAFEPRAGESARPFSFAGSEVDRARATQCLATAVLYEAGDDTVGQAAVAQVVLNRVRHPAFPSTICGVVYQGSERRTGCQFTFTCDGSLARRAMSDAAWRRARTVAEAALSGKVDTTVGLATHYHTNWVYPYWSPSLRKLAQVGTHLFFGWPGNWGGAAAFSKAYRGNESVGRIGLAALPKTPDDGDIDPAGTEQPKILGLPQAPARLPEGRGKVPLYGNKLRLARPDGRAFGLLSPPGVSAAQVVNAALALCSEPGPCRVQAWSNEDDIPCSYPVPVLTRATMVFEYVREGGGAGGTTRFDCSRFPNRDPKACLEASGDVPELLKGVQFR